MALPVDYSQQISSLLNRAEKETFNPHKFDFFCKAVKLQFKSDLINDAQVSFDKALKLLQNHDLDEIPNLLKLAKLSILIHPKQRPALLVQAEENALYRKKWAEEQEDGKTVLGNTYGGYFGKLADCFYRLKNTSSVHSSDNDKADQYLDVAIDWAGSGGLPPERFPERLMTYKKIAKACVIGNKKDHFLTLIPRIESECNSIMGYFDKNKSLSWRLKMTEIVYNIDQNCAKRLLASSKGFIEENRTDLSSHNHFVDLTNQYQVLEQKMQ